MGIFQGDVIIKAMVELGIEEMKKNPWLLDHAFESVKQTRYLSDRFGQKQIDSAKEWLANNTIDVYLRPRNDKDRTPCVTIYPGQSNEKLDMKSMGDQSTERKILMPNNIGQPIPYVVKPFPPLGYDPSTGYVTLSINTIGIDAVVPGQVLVNPANATGYIIQDVVGVDSNTVAIVIEQGLMEVDATELGVVPEFQYFEARVEHTWHQETYSIGCYAHGDPQNLIFLHTIVLYAIMRYRQTLLEGNGFDESYVSSGEITEDKNFTGPGGEENFVRFITLSGQVEQSWIKAPQRFIESIVFKDRSSPNEITGGIKILSNFDAPPTIDTADENWFTVEDDPEEV
jgi:hypothetical protein